MTANLLHSTSPVPGETAPDLTLPDSDGVERLLSEIWSNSERGCAVVFLRHFGCIFCSEHATQLRRDHQQFLDRGYAVVAIGLGSVQRAAKFKHDHALPFAVLADSDQRGYQAYGLGRGTLGDIFNPVLLVKSAKALFSGARQGRTSGDASQLPGTFIVDPAGYVRYAKPAKIASDLATTAELIAWIDRSARK